MTLAPRDPLQPRAIAMDGAWSATALAASLPVALNLAIPGGLTPVESAGAAALLLLACWRPLDALLVTAALVPLGGTLGALVAGEVSAARWMLGAVLIGVVGAVLRGEASTRDVPRWLTAAALVLAWLALASVAVQVLRDRAWFETDAAWRSDAWAFLSTDFFGGRSRWRRATSGVLLAQQALLVPAVASVALRAGGASRLAAMAAAGAVGVAAHNVFRVIESAVRSGDTWTSLVTLAQSARISAAFVDANAAGSYFALSLLLVGGLLWHSVQGRRRAAACGWAAATLLVGAAFYLTGSRIALAVALPAALAGIALTRERVRVTRRGLAVVALATAATIALVVTAHARRGRNDAPVAVFVRMEFVGTTWRMLQDHPVFGVGAGAFLRESAHYSSAELRRYYPAQNAHNNFLQVAGELGPIALAALLVLVGLPPWRAARVVGRGSGPMAAGLWAGTIAFLLTCLGGHPLLVPEVAASFAVALGILTAIGGPAAPAASGRSRVWPTAALLLLPAALVASVPARARAERATLELEHARLGPERWTEDADGTATARFRGTVAFFVRTDGDRMMLALRVISRARRPVDVELRLDGRPINAVRLDGSDWQSVPVVLPHRGKGEHAVLRLEAAWAAPGARGRPVLEVRRPQPARR